MMMINPQKFLFLFTFVFLLISFWIESYAQTIQAPNVRYVPEVEKIFSEGVNEYRNGKYKEATVIFENLANFSPVHQRITAAYLMSGKCYYQLNDNDKAINILNKLITEYPKSNYIDDAYYTLAFCYYESGDYNSSLNAFLFVADNGKGKKIIERSRNNALTIIDNNITFNELQQLRERATGEISSTIITIKLAHRFLQQGNRGQAISLLQNFVLQYPKNPYLSTVREFLRRNNTVVPSTEVNIGVILPLSGEYSEQARAVLAGIQYAQKKFNTNSDVMVNLIVKDSEGDMIKLIKSTQDLAKDDRIIAIIGELERDKTIAIAAVLNNLNIPLIAPTTSENGVTLLNDYIFQINCDLENRGRALAYYSIKELGLKTFATLAPADKYGKDMTDSFTAIVDQLGGKIIAQKWYYSDTKDLKRQFQSIRALGFNLGYKDTVGVIYNRELGSLRDDNVPVTLINGVFFPCYTEEIQYIAPQFALANIKAQIIGGEYWYDSEKLRTNQTYVDGIIFCSNYYFDETNPEFIKFRNDFRIFMKRTPEIMESYGYNAMGVLLEAVSHKQTTRGDIKNYLDNLENFAGLGGPITFKGNNRVNAEVRILTYKNNRIEVLK